MAYVQNLTWSKQPSQANETIVDTNLLKIGLGAKLSHTGSQTCKTERTGAEPVIDR